MDATAHGLHSFTLSLALHRSPPPLSMPVGPPGRSEVGCHVPVCESVADSCSQKQGSCLGCSDGNCEFYVVTWIRAEAQPAVSLLAPDVTAEEVEWARDHAKSSEVLQCARGYGYLHSGYNRHKHCVSRRGYRPVGTSAEHAGIFRCHHSRGSCHKVGHGDKGGDGLELLWGAAELHGDPDQRQDRGWQSSNQNKAGAPILCLAQDLYSIANEKQRKNIRMPRHGRSPVHPPVVLVLQPRG